MDAGGKFVIGLILSLAAAYVAVSLFFPEILTGIGVNMQPINFRFDLF